MGDYCVCPDQNIVKQHGFNCSGILIDGTIAYSSFDHDFEKDKLWSYDQEELKDVNIKIADAISLIHRQTPQVGRFVTTSISAIVVQKSSTSEIFFSGSRSSLIGKAGFANPHAASTHALIDALIHEAVHSFLHKIELGEVMSYAFFIDAATMLVLTQDIVNGYGPENS